MALDKGQVQRNFNRGALTYDQYAGIQKETAAELMGMLTRSGRRYHRILEIGCGTGILTELLAREYPRARILAFDIAPEMVRAAQTKLNNYQGITYLVADGENLQLAGQVSFDLIVSNMVFQWFTGYLRPFALYYKALAEGGDFIFNTLGKGTFAELYTCLNRPEPFVDRKLLGEVLVQAGYQENQVKESVKLEYFVSSREFLRALKKIGAHNYLVDGLGTSGTGQEIFKIINRYDERFRNEQGVPATYHCLIGSGHKGG